MQIEYTKQESEMLGVPQQPGIMYSCSRHGETACLGVLRTAMFVE